MPNKPAITYRNNKLLIEGITFWITFRIKCSESTASQSLGFNYPSFQVFSCLLSACKFISLLAIIEHSSSVLHRSSLVSWNQT